MRIYGVVRLDNYRSIVSDLRYVIVKILGISIGKNPEKLENLNLI